MKTLIALVILTGCAATPTKPVVSRPLTRAEQQAEYRQQERFRQRMLEAYRAGWRPAQTVIVHEDRQPAPLVNSVVTEPEPVPYPTPSRAPYILYNNDWSQEGYAYPQ